MKITFDEWKKYFTLDEIERVKAHKAEMNKEECEAINSILEVLAGNRETLKINLTWGYKRDYPENTYYGDGIEICVNAWYYDDIERKVQHVHCGLWDICQICDREDRERCGYIRTYSEK